MTAIQALDTIVKVGVRIIPGPDRPRLGVPSAVREQVRPLVQAHREELRRLILGATCTRIAGRILFFSDHTL
jgi:hypothetical protein